jgi:hypothetical protein
MKDENAVFNETVCVGPQSTAVDVEKKHKASPIIAVEKSTPPSTILTTPPTSGRRRRQQGPPNSASGQKRQRSLNMQDDEFSFLT